MRFYSNHIIWLVYLFAHVSLESSGYLRLRFTLLNFRLFGHWHSFNFNQRIWCLDLCYSDDLSKSYYNHFILYIILQTVRFWVSRKRKSNNFNCWRNRPVCLSVEKLDLRFRWSDINESMYFNYIYSLNIWITLSKFEKSKRCGSFDLYRHFSIIWIIMRIWNIAL